MEFHPKVTYIVGKNGTGKSTIFEAIAVAYRFNPEMESIMESKDISANPAERLLLTLHVLQSIIAKKEVKQELYSVRTKFRCRTSTNQAW